MVSRLACSARHADSNACEVLISRAIPNLAKFHSAEPATSFMMSTTSWGFSSNNAGYPAAISGTAASAASSPTNFQRLKCSFSTTRANKTVTAG